MTTLLKPGIEKLMRIFYDNKQEAFHLRELSRKSGLEGQSITRHLNFLEKNNFLQSKYEGNQRRYSIISNKRTYAIFIWFDIEKFEKLPPLRKQAIATYLNNLQKQPILAIMFGSTAKETYHKESDIDIVLITNNKIDTKNAEKEADVLHAIKISTFQMEYQDFIKELKLKEDKVIQSAIRTGYPLINHIQHYEIISNERV